MQSTTKEDPEEREFIHAKSGSIWGKQIDEAYGWVTIELTKPLQGVTREWQPDEQVQVRKSLIDNIAG